MNYTSSTPPKANWKLVLVDDETYPTFIQMYLKKPPNAFQRWFLHKLTGIKWVPI